MILAWSKIRPLSLVVLAALAAPGCGSDDATAPSGAGPAQPSTWEDLDPARPGQRLRDPRSGVAFVRVEPGEFVMGSERPDEGPRRRVRLTRPFLLAETEVPVAAWRRHAAASGQRSDLPIPADDRLPIPASWDDAQRFCAFFGYRLPTEAEWEFACLGSRTPDDPTFRDPARVASMAWIHANAGEGSKPVATREPNPLGLRDMLGNLWEWCSDWYAPGYRGRPDPDVDPAGPPSGAGRVLRGGSWFTLPFPTPECRTGDDEHVRSDFYGFRPAVDLPR